MPSGRHIGRSIVSYAHRWAGCGQFACRDRAQSDTGMDHDKIWVSHVICILCSVANWDHEHFSQTILQSVTEENNFSDEQLCNCDEMTIANSLKRLGVNYEEEEEESTITGSELLMRVHTLLPVYGLLKSNGFLKKDCERKGCDTILLHGNRVLNQDLSLEIVDTNFLLHNASKPLMLRPKASIVLTTDITVAPTTSPTYITSTPTTPSNSVHVTSDNYLMWFTLINTDLEWWQTNIIYQIYPISFQDSDGDGKGDLKGIRSRLDYFTETGVKIIWLSPIYTSPKIDNGYDISNFTDIDPMFGTLDDFKDLVKDLKDRGMYILLDFVPNHTSDEHEWFQKSIKRIEPYTDYYIWRDPKEIFPNGTKVPPCNWLGLFGGSAWTYNEDRQQFYFHKFLVQQPDLNFYNKNVREEMKNVLKFWLDLGVDGFRVDAVRSLTEDPELHDELCLPEFNTCDNEYFKINHNYTDDWPDTYEVVYEWRKFLDSYAKSSPYNHTRIMLTEAYSAINYIMLYYGNGSTQGAQLPFNFLLMYTDIESNSTVYKYLIDLWFDNMVEGQWANWVTGNHDHTRIATKMGNEIVDGFAMLSMLLPGTTITYQGEELGQTDSMVRQDQLRDGHNTGPISVRDPYRGPFPWNDTPNGGFSSNKFTWGIVNPSYWEMNLEAQKKAEKSHYKIYKQLVNLRRKPTIQRGDLNLYIVSTWVLAFSRKLPGNESYVILINFGSEMEIILIGEVIPNFPDKLSVAISSINSGYKDGEIVDTKFLVHNSSKPLILRPKASVVLTTDITVVPTTSPENITSTTPTSNTVNVTNNNYLIWFSLINTIIVTYFGKYC
ncbi:alpha-glucosidase-like [Lycorma delicatula]|uniref:alpha-glucosidase-like n=1 Tax=Lycorma delicatula TaxID=130591 RepID=UPI003F5192ED